MPRLIGPSLQSAETDTVSIPSLQMENLSSESSGDQAQVHMLGRGKVDINTLAPTFVCHMHFLIYFYEIGMMLPFYK